MAASNPAVTIAITACSILTSIYFDTIHTRDKRKLFDELKKQLTLGKDIPDPSQAMEGIRWGGTLVSTVALLGYSLFSSFNPDLIAVYASTLAAVLSCHVGRKIYDSQLGADIHIMQEERDSMFALLGIKSVDQAREHLGEMDKIQKNHDRLLRKLDALLQAIRDGKIVNTTEIQKHLIELRETRGIAAEPLGSSARTLDSLGHDEARSAQVGVVTDEASISGGEPASTVPTSDGLPRP